MKSLFTLFFVAVGIILACIARRIVKSSRCGQDSGKGAAVGIVTGKSRNMSTKPTL